MSRTAAHLPKSWPLCCARNEALLTIGEIDVVQALKTSIFAAVSGEGAFALQDQRDD